MSLAQVSLEIGGYRPRGPWQRRVSFGVDLGRRPVHEGVAPPAAAEGQADDSFEEAVARLVNVGYERERARHVIAIRMKYPEHVIARLREVAS